MFDLLIASVISCSEADRLISNVMKSQQSTIDKHELIEVIKLNTKPECYERPELD
jgi:hypothetical protein